MRKGILSGLILIVTFVLVRAQNPISTGGSSGAAGSAGAAGATGATGPGISGLTTGTIPKAASSSTLADSLVMDSGTVVTVNANSGSFLVGTGSNVSTYMAFASPRTFIGYDGAAVLMQGGTGKSLKLITNSATFGTPGNLITMDTSGNLVLSTAGTGVQGGYLEGNGAVPGISGCSAGTQLGGNTIGSFASGTTGTCTTTLTFLFTAAHAWSCFAQDTTTPGDLIGQTGGSTTTAVLAGTTISGDVIKFACFAY